MVRMPDLTRRSKERTMSKSPEQAYKTALHLNNKYFLDGRDPVAYANVAWLFGLHDRPWASRECG